MRNALSSRPFMLRLSLLWLTGAAAAAGWCDFDATALGSQWQVRGKVAVSRVEVTGAPGDAGPRGKVMQVQSEARAIIESRADQLPLPPLAGCEDLTLWVQRSDEAGEPLVFDVMFIEPDRQAAFWRKVEVTGAGWQQVTLPLRWFRWEAGRVPRWDQLASFGIRTRGTAGFAIDGIAFNDHQPETSASYSAAELAGLAFGQRNEGVTTHTDETLWLLTDEPALEVDALARHLAGVLAAMQADLPLTTRQAGCPRLVVFSKSADYQAFVPRFAGQLGAVASPPSCDGYHLQGVALSSWKPELGTLRPVFTHEFCHSVLSHHALTDSAHSDWWQEGVANCYQLRFHPQAYFGELVREGLANEDRRSSLEELCTGGDVPLHRYWQVATLVGMLIAEPQYRDQLPAMMAAFQQTGSTDLRPHLGPVFSRTWDELTQDWMNWCAKTYPSAAVH